MKCNNCKKEVSQTYWDKIRKWWLCEKCTDYLQKVK